MKSWGQIISMLGHQNRTINVLKIDVEGAEYSVRDSRALAAA